MQVVGTTGVGGRRRCAALEDGREEEQQPVEACSHGDGQRRAARLPCLLPLAPSKKHRCQKWFGLVWLKDTTILHLEDYLRGQD